MLGSIENPSLLISFEFHSNKLEELDLDSTGEFPCTLFNEFVVGWWLFWFTGWTFDGIWFAGWLFVVLSDLILFIRSKEPFAIVTIAAPKNEPSLINFQIFLPAKLGGVLEKDLKFDWVF